MKHILISLALISGVTAYAQNTVQVKSSGIQKTKKVRVIAKEEECSPTCKDYEDWHTVTDTLPADTLKGAKTDTTELKIGNTRVIIIGEPKIERIERIEEEDIASRKQEEENAKKSKLKLRFFQFDFGYVNLVARNGDPYNPNVNNIMVSQLELNRSQSRYVGFHIANVTVPIIKNYLKISSGVGVEYNNYRFAKNISIAPEKDNLTIINDSVDFDKNKLLTKYLMVPLMLQVQTKSRDQKHAFKFAIGVELGYLLGARTKQISKERGKKIYEDDFGVAPSVVNVVARLGYGDFGAFIKSSTNDLFSQAPPYLQSVAFGITTRF